MNKPIEELIQRLKEPDYKYYGCELSRGDAELAISALEKTSDKNCSRCIDKGKCAIYDNFNIDYCSDWRGKDE